MGTQSRERRANRGWRIGAREGDSRGKSWGLLETGHVAKHAGGNKGQRIPTKNECEGSGEGWGLWCKERAGGARAG